MTKATRSSNSPADLTAKTAQTSDSGAIIYQITISGYPNNELGNNYEVLGGRNFARRHTGLCPNNFQDRDFNPKPFPVLEEKRTLKATFTLK